MDILAALRHQERQSRSGDLEDDRQEALDRFHGRPYGDEVEGRSQVVMRDIADTVAWLMPSLLKIFAAGDEVVRFDPVGPEDEEQSQQETDYCNHVLMSKNQGFLILHDWFHDALVQRNGYVMVRSVTKTRSQTERYQNLSDAEFQALVQSEGLELLEHDERESIEQTTMGPIIVKVHDAAVRSVQEYPCVEVINIPPERVRVAPDWPHLHFDGCQFFEAEDWLTVSQLREQGYDIPDDINDDGEDDADDEVSDIARSQSQDGQWGREDIEADPATRRLRVRYAWLRFDEDGDGIAELRRLVVVGTTILENEEDDLIPAASLTPGRLPHEHVGQSVDDWVADLQRIRTVLTRGFLDNLYMSQHPQTYVDMDRVNIDDMLTIRVGGIRRTKGDPRTAVMESIRPDTGPMSLQAIEYIDTIRENRTGVTRYNQGLDANSLNKTASGISQIMTASQQRIELIARVFAETGVKNLMLIVHAMSVKNGRQAEMVKLRNQWVQVDPRSWKTRRDITISVGIGSGNREQQLQQLYAVWQQQMQVMPMGLASPANVYATLKRITAASGFKNGEEFWTDPTKQPPKPPPPNPDMVKAQIEAQSKQQDMQIKQQTAAADIQFRQQEAAIELEKAKVELQIKLIDLEIKKEAAAISQQTAMVNATAKMMTASDDAARAEEIRND
jgi:hypothetical protein